MHKLSWFVSYRRISPQFQFSLSAAALGIYLYGSRTVFLLDQLGAQTVQTVVFWLISIQHTFVLLAN